MRGRLRIIAPCLLLALALQGLALAEPTAEQQELLTWVRTLQMQDHMQAALDMCATILAADPNCAQAYCERGIIYLTQERYSEAETEFTVAVAIGPDLIQGYVGRARARLALGDDGGGRADANRAVRMCAQALEENQRDADAYYLRGLARRVIGDEADASWDLTRAVEIRPDFAEARLERAHIYRRQGKLQLAIQHCTEAIEARPDYVSAWLTRARAYYQAQDYQAAIADCTGALQVNSDSARAHFNRGLVYAKAGDPPSALADFTRATEIEPDYADAWLYRGEASYAQGDTEAARAAWQRAVELAPDEWAGQTAAQRLKSLETPGAN